MNKNETLILQDLALRHPQLPTRHRRRRQDGGADGRPHHAVHLITLTKLTKNEKDYQLCDGRPWKSRPSSSIGLTKSITC